MKTWSMILLTILMCSCPMLFYACNKKQKKSISPGLSIYMYCSLSTWKDLWNDWESLDFLCQVSMQWVLQHYCYNWGFNNRIFIFWNCIIILLNYNLRFIVTWCKNQSIMSSIIMRISYLITLNSGIQTRIWTGSWVLLIGLHITCLYNL